MRCGSPAPHRIAAQIELQPAFLRRARTADLSRFAGFYALCCVWGHFGGVFRRPGRSRTDIFCVCAGGSPGRFGRFRLRCNTMRKNPQKPSPLPTPPNRHGRRGQAGCGRRHRTRPTTCASPTPNPSDSLHGANPKSARKPAWRTPCNSHEAARGSIPLSRC